jgi:hypothetical protein
MLREINWRLITVEKIQDVNGLGGMLNGLEIW